MINVLVAIAFLADPSSDGGRANRPPRFENVEDTWSCQVGVTCELPINAVDPDHDPITITTSPLPAGAKLQPVVPGSEFESRHRRPAEHAFLQFKPTADQTGEHVITLTVSDGQDSVTHDVTLEVTQEWEVFAMPGVSALSYVPRETVQTGGYVGPSIEILIASWAHRNNKQGPSHGRVYADLDLLFPLSGHGGNLYAYTAGADLTLERNPSRRYLLPYFGAELGGVHSALLGDYFFATPYAGVHLWADRNLWVDASAGYVLPGRALDALSGPWTKLGLNLTFW